MDNALSDRIDNAWKVCRRWINERDGSANEVMFVDVTAASLLRLFETCEIHAVSFAYEPTWRASARPIPLNACNVVQCLQSDEMASCSLSYITCAPGFQFSVRLITDRNIKGLYDLDAIWFPENAFPENAEVCARFHMVFAYFIHLEHLLKTRRLFIGPESLDDPRSGNNSWIEA